MRNTKQAGFRRVRFQYRALTAATLSTLAAAGLTKAAVLLPNYEHNVPVSSIGYIGPVNVQKDTVATGNTFNIAVIGFNIANTSSGFVVNDAAYLVGPLTPTFGTTLTAPGATSDGETATVTTSETSSKGKTTDKVTFSVPTAFVPANSTFTDGDVINEEDLEIGFDAGTKGLTFSLPVTTAITASGTGVYTYNGTSGTYTFSAAKGSAPYTQLNATDTQLSADEGLDDFAGGDTYTPADITYLDLRTFSFTFSYATPTPAVPEPGSAALGLMAGGATLLRRRSRTKSSSIVDLSTGLVDEPVTAAAQSA